MIDQMTLFEKYDLEKKYFRTAQRHWKKLEAINEDYLHIRDSLEPHANTIAGMLTKQVSRVHSVKSRLKDPEHLIAKIIKKGNLTKINKDNYRDLITDLIGLRALHLFKDDWIYIHQYITKTWGRKEKPTANIREGDPKELIQTFKKLGCNVRLHPAGYRSVHYSIISQVAKEKQVAEIQVRTIFEEGWSEIDHQIRYPYNLKNEAINQFLVIFNRLAGSADEMGSFIKFLQVYFERKEKESQKALQEKTALISQLMERIDQMSIEKKEKTYIKSGLEDLNKMASKHPSIRDALKEFNQESILSRNVELLKGVFFSKEDLKPDHSK